jgi:hypothetical protein
MRRVLNFVLDFARPSDWLGWPGVVVTDGTGEETSGVASLATPIRAESLPRHNPLTTRRVLGGAQCACGSTLGSIEKGVDMSKETYIAYWSGEEQTGPGKAPTLVETPDYVDIVPLFYVVVGSEGTLDFNRLTLHNSQKTIKKWMQEVRAREVTTSHQKKTKFTLVLLGSSFPSLPPDKFAQTVKAAVDDWDADGVTIDYEPPDDDERIIRVVKAIKDALGPKALMTAPIYSAWIGMKTLKGYAAQFTHLSTMDYSPYVGEGATIELYDQYAAAIGTRDNPEYEKIAIGVSCMNPKDQRYTPLGDVTKLCRFEPGQGRHKLGIMLFTLSYDVKSHGSGYPDGTFTETIHKHLP